MGRTTATPLKIKNLSMSHTTYKNNLQIKVLDLESQILKTFVRKYKQMCLYHQKRQGVKTQKRTKYRNE